MGGPDPGPRSGSVVERFGLEGDPLGEAPDLSNSTFLSRLLEDADELDRHFSLDDLAAARKPGEDVELNSWSTLDRLFTL